MQHARPNGSDSLQNPMLGPPIVQLNNKNVYVFKILTGKQHTIIREGAGYGCEGCHLAQRT